ncbi:sensor histidine kinase [Hahella sp. KA22]|uniref:sensor histidine kinase n=1 Tax=Hahella sp. KA22 TaxID=1628392 RepID=UPI000FDE3BE9|nr:sensor histidine kinase [Hahella sp. KA22]AZZ93810.1 sensor histidine kinase [Hahella sp. KA22]QAY57183.1 sensor histidine kinase [Hahella sp. KA22]
MTNQEPSLYHLRKRLLNFIAPWSVLLLALSFFLYDYLLDNKLSPLQETASGSLNSAYETMARNFGDLATDIRFLAHNKAIRNATPDSKQGAEALLQDFSEASGIYDQVRWLGPDGKELVRVETFGSQAIRIPEEQLQEKSKRYYFISGMALNPEEIYFSPLDLNIEHGAIQTPHNPVLRAVSPIHTDHGEHNGVIVLNYKANLMLQALRNLHLPSSLRLHLLNSDGYWLLSNHPKDEWGFMFKRSNLRFGVRHPEGWDRIINTNYGTFTDDDGLWLFTTFSPTSNHSKDDQYWKLVVNVEPTAISAIQREALASTLGLIITLWVILFFAFIRIARADALKDTLNAQLSARSGELEHANTLLQESLDNLMRTQDELVRAEKLSSLGMMVAGVAHELNTPLGASLVTLSSMQRQAVELKEAFARGLRRSDMNDYFARFEQGAGIILSNLNRSAQLVHSFKQLATDRAGAERRVFSLRGLIEDMLLTTWLRIHKREHQLVTDIDPDLELDSYPGALSQVLENLVNNAMKHAFQDMPQGRVWLSAQRRNDQIAEIEVRDNGAGIPPEILPKVFDPFFTTKRNQGGTGLGLHLTHQLVTNVLGGTINISSAIGHGCVVKIELPLHAPATEERDVEQKEEEKEADTGTRDASITY